MLDKLKSFFDKSFSKESETESNERENALKLATATLLIEVVRADYEEDKNEIDEVISQLKSFFDLSDEEAELLLTEAKDNSDHSVSLQEFTRLLHEELSIDEKNLIITMLWKVAFSDKNLDKYEDYIVRKISDLLYIPHSEMIRLRNIVKNNI
ncbi:MAG: TerB family tellurite resistance protein [Pseudomonadota bacterium]|nr:hypothetical protein [Gammaproteobacteria bacterium]MEE2684366.1 TerB family tellurite resistance protein [Pseudomonadota bacterium]|tara:strand:+ start:2764 stop:3222 length:459 start_codon:yes stop_codon:yes gene_type:complete